MYQSFQSKQRRPMVLLPLPGSSWWWVNISTVDRAVVVVFGSGFTPNHSVCDFASPNHPNSHHHSCCRILPSLQSPWHCHCLLLRSVLNEGSVDFLHLCLHSCLSYDHHRNPCASPPCVSLSSLYLCSRPLASLSMRHRPSPRLGTYRGGGPHPRKRDSTGCCFLPSSLLSVWVQFVQKPFVSVVSLSYA